MKLSDWIEAYKTEDDLNYYIPDYKIERLYELEKERDAYKKAAEEWMNDFDKLKEKYEPSVLIAEAERIQARIK